MIRREELLSLGGTDNDIKTALKTGLLEPLGWGVYAFADDTRTKERKYRLMVDAATVTDGAVFSYESAAAMHDLPMLKPPLDRVSMTSLTTDTGYVRPRRHLHPGPLADSEVTTHGARPVTTLERTVFDVARTSRMRLPGALAVVDAGLRMGADVDILTEMSHRRVRGVALFRKALEFADPLSENPGESWGRAQMIAAGLPVPRLQHTYRDSQGFVGRTDYDWRDLLVGEFDGLVKYLNHRREGESIEQAVIREKQREDRLRALGIMVIRWVWADLENERVVPKLFVSGSTPRSPTPVSRGSSTHTGRRRRTFPVTPAPRGRTPDPSTSPASATTPGPGRGTWDRR